VTVYVGTSGWQYAHWRRTFYPEGLPQADWLDFYAQRFQTVEINSSFYRLPERATFERWRDGTPGDFIHCPKASRFLTHMKKLREPEQHVRLFLERADGLDAKLGPVLVQLPATFKAAPDRLAQTLAAFPRPVRVAVELRHDSWFIDEVRDILADRGAALCLADRRSKPVTPLWRTADWGYVRLHEGAGRPHPCYGRSAIAAWAARVAELWPADENVFVFFNNDPRACALRDAQWFAHACARRGLPHTRVPPAADVRIDDS
jgi:uncharacterized protein YecE (DUF72 family)